MSPGSPKATFHERTRSTPLYCALLETPSPLVHWGLLGTGAYVALRTGSFTILAQPVLIVKQFLIFFFEYQKYGLIKPFFWTASKFRFLLYDQTREFWALCKTYSYI